MAAMLAATPASAVICKSPKTEIFFEHATMGECGISQPSYRGTGLVEADFFGSSYILSYKSDEHGKGDGTVGFTHTVGDKYSPGTWALDSFKGIDSIVFGFKKGPEYFAFLLDDATWLSGTWTLIRNGKNAESYGHLDVWYKAAPTSVVPLPASALFLLSGIGGMSFIGWRRRRDAATA